MLRFSTKSLFSDRHGCLSEGYPRADTPKQGTLVASQKKTNSTTDNSPLKAAKRNSLVELSCYILLNENDPPIQPLWSQLGFALTRLPYFYIYFFKHTTITDCRCHLCKPQVFPSAASLESKGWQPSSPSALRGENVRGI